jgi:hypothetical protein
VFRDLILMTNLHYLLLAAKDVSWQKQWYGRGMVGAKAVAVAVIGP